MSKHIIQSILKEYPKIKVDNSLIDQDHYFCCACEEIDSTNNNQIVFCDLCDCPIHQHCYGNDLIDLNLDEDWFCDRCLYLIKNYPATPPSCIFCTQNVSVMLLIQINNTSQWAHPSCVKWNTNLVREQDKKYLAKPNYLNQNKEIVCRYCFDSNGFLSQCGQCDVYFHIGCAKINGMLIHERGMAIMRRFMRESSKSKKKVGKQIYCLEHIIEMNKSLIECHNKQQINLQKHFLNVCACRIDTYYSLNGKSEQSEIIDQLYVEPNKLIQSQVQQQPNRRRLKQKSMKQQFSDDMTEQDLRNQLANKKVKQEYESFLKNKLTTLLQTKCQQFMDKNIKDVIYEDQILNEYIQIDHQLSMILFAKSGFHILNLEAFDKYLVQYLFINDMLYGNDENATINLIKQTQWKDIAKELQLKNGMLAVDFISIVRSKKLKIVNPELEKIKQNWALNQLLGNDDDNLIVI